MNFSLPYRGLHLENPRKTAVPVLVSSPHSGRVYPDNFLETSCLPFRDLQQSEDRFVDRLLENTPDLGMTLLCAEFPRVWCDVNRDWREVDATMFSPPPPADEIISTAKVSAGFGVIPRSVSLGRQIYDHPLDLQEKEMRLASAWLPYHETLSAILTEMHASFGYAVLLEIHSMPPLPYARSPDIVLGDVHGKSCHSDMTTLVEDLFEERKYTVRRNIPYSGGYITRSYGQPQNNIHALQIEICRSLYLNASTLEESSGFSRTRENLTEILEDFSSRIETGLLRPSVKQF